MREIATEGRKGTPGTREDGQLWGAFPNTMTIKDLAAHVVSKLTDAGYSIVQLPELDDLDCVSAAPGSGKVRCYLDDARMTADDARDLAGLLLAAAAAAEGEKP